VFTLKRIILITGPPGIGKTSTLRRAVKELKRREYAVGGMICSEVREGGIRVGFEIKDLSAGERGWLAHLNQPEGPKIGKYRVNLMDLEVVGVGSILSALQTADILAVDEIGPMELVSQAFSNALIRAVESSKPMLGTIHYGLKNPIITDIKNREDVEILKVTYENRETLHNIIANNLSEQLTNRIETSIQPKEAEKTIGKKFYV
jgi:nucleoside-triphosphatase